MNYYLIVCQSITYAQRASRALRVCGITHQMLRLPVGLVKSGCGYALKVRCNDLKSALNAMSRERMRPRALFVHDGEGYREVGYDLS